MPAQLEYRIYKVNIYIQDSISPLVEIGKAWQGTRRYVNVTPSSLRRAQRAQLRIEQEKTR